MLEYKMDILSLVENDIVDQIDYIVIDLKFPRTAINMAKEFEKVIDSFKLFPQFYELDEDEKLKDRE